MSTALMEDPRAAEALPEQIRRRLEALAWRVRVEDALDRVRARALAMRRSDESLDLVTTVFEELQALGMDDVVRVYINIIDADAGVAEHWATELALHERKHQPAPLPYGIPIPLTEYPPLIERLEAWKRREPVVVYPMSRDEMFDFITYLGRHTRYSELREMEGGRHRGELAETTYMTDASFAHGMIGISSTQAPTPEQLDALQRFARALDLGYTRLLDLERAETRAREAVAALDELKAAQEQLVQSEKLASLGQLTAGIAHEIKNPLNFVNNFAELSRELADDLREALDGEVEPDTIEEIVGDLQSNADQIVKHGRRADAIVRSMMQHARGTTGEQVAVDLNEFVEEYLGLAYHGMRARIPDFNVTLARDFEPDVGAVEVLPQELGRVLVNLLNNAFDAVRERGLDAPETYVPTVTVATRATEQGVAVEIRDNGTGMPESVRERIFDPFFTTKPTGEGTGLGLSISYDLVVGAHGGALRVESEPGVYTAFVIELPRTAS